MISVGRLFRVILYVQDMQRMVEFYRDVLRLPLCAPRPKTDYSDDYWVEFAAGSCAIVLHGGGQMRLGEDTPKLAFRVADIESTRATLIRRGVDMGEIRSPAPGVRVADGFDPEGHPFSIDCHN